MNIYGNVLYVNLYYCCIILQISEHKTSRQGPVPVNLDMEIYSFLIYYKYAIASSSSGFPLH